jgi:hypothetical protein
MALANAYLVSANRIQEFFKQIKDGQAPERLTQMLLRDWGFASTNDRAFIPLLKAIGFVSPEGKPTQRYNDYRDHSKSRVVLGEALKDAYSDLFLIKSNPSESDRDAVKGKFKSYHNTSDHVAGLMTKTFYALLSMADINSSPALSISDSVAAENSRSNSQTTPNPTTARLISGLHYNIQIHLPPTKDVEVYNAIFKALRTHLVDE